MPKNAQTLHCGLLVKSNVTVQQNFVTRGQVLYAPTACDVTGAHDVSCRSEVERSPTAGH